MLLRDFQTKRLDIQTLLNTVMKTEFICFFNFAVSQYNAASRYNIFATSWFFSLKIKVLILFFFNWNKVEKISQERKSTLSWIVYSKYMYEIYQLVFSILLKLRNLIGWSLSVFLALVKKKKK